MLARGEEPQLRIVEIPAAINVGAEYGVAVREGAPAAAARFADELRAGPGQAVLRQAGFLAP